MIKNNLSYNDLFNHVEKIEKVLLIAVGRAGSDFFHSLLDEHSQIVQFPGYLNIHEFWNKSLCKNSVNDIIHEFIWSTSSSHHIGIFKSYYNKTERWEQLGDNRDEYFEVNIDIFINHFICLMNKKKLNSKNFFIAIHTAYALTIGIDINKTKILFYNIHHIVKLKDFKKDFDKFSIIATIRYPINTISSSVNNYLQNSEQSSYGISMGNILSRIYYETEEIDEYSIDITIIKLEDLHIFSVEILNNFCKKYKLEFQNSLMKSTFGGKKWWGDRVSGKFLDGFNNNITKDKGDENFFWYDRFMIESILYDRMNHYSYKPLNNLAKFKFMYIITFIIILLPMRLELRLFYFNLKKLKNQFTLSGFIYTFVYSIIFYIKRILINYKFLYKSITGYIKLPKFFSKYNIKEG